MPQMAFTDQDDTVRAFGEIVDGKIVDGQPQTIGAVCAPLVAHVCAERLRRLAFGWIVDAARQVSAKH